MWGLDFFIAYLDLMLVDAVNILKACLGFAELVLRFTPDIIGPEPVFIRIIAVHEGRVL
jgi:hypothetical protein